ncbi:MAG: NADH-quinone oxidoreductase subunit H [Candidatus Aenigmatarchaeota archaeon]|nr:MAG: NADH-quinone oxidoreductase subunit H [Candidatus Aenigmarchaeota archaeon]
MIDFTLAQVLMVIPMAVLAIVLGLLYKGIDRRLAAQMQSRIGPPISQPFRDIKKLMFKENIVPKAAIPWLFNMMPVLALASSLILFMYVPVLGFPAILEGHGDLILIIYLLIVPSLALVIGGFSSGSRYATVGAQREMVNMISYEVPLAITVVSLAWLVSGAVPGLAAFSLGTLSFAPVWTTAGIIGTLGLALLLAVMIIVSTGEMGVIPFDTAEAETEIAAGLLAEYSGRNLALFYLADAVKIVVLGSLVIALFIPFGISGFFGLSGIAADGANALFYLLKLFIVMFLSSTFIRVAVPRLRITQVVKAYWGYTTLVALIGLLLIGVDVLLKVF